MPIASAQVKSALLLSGLYADGPTALKEPVLSRDHTERMMRALGIPLEAAGPMCVLDPDGWERRWNAFDWTIPGDISSAAFVLAAVHAVEGSMATIGSVGVNPSRTGILDALVAMGSDARAVPKGDGAGGEPIADLEVTHRTLRGGLIGGELLTRMIDEVPALCSLAAASSGTIEIRDARELRVKESDRIAAMASVLDAFGIPCEEFPDGMRIEGGHRPSPAKVKSLGDHRIAMAAAILALSAQGESVVEDVECVDTSFPGFVQLLRELGAQIREVT
jgi:3-phosphoshikimate 1-carboxyvinyltransferase